MNFCDLIYKSQPVRFACPQVRQENIAGLNKRFIVVAVNDKRGRLSHYVDVDACSIWILYFVICALFEFWVLNFEF